MLIYKDLEFLSATIQNLTYTILCYRSSKGNFTTFNGNLKMQFFLFLEKWSGFLGDINTQLENEKDNKTGKTVEMATCYELSNIVDSATHVGNHWLDGVFSKNLVSNLKLDH